VDSAVADPNAPNLSVRATGKQSATGGKGVFAHLERTGVHIDGDDFALVASFNLWPHLLLV